ncbi:substrate-binding periplasmic protein [Chitinimonas sp.]|uniref:substrate-binding periplasmic protein n=1 Tax=Chitinimonas sp. TaxID=1934313 RepID=UPI002F92C272
MRRLALILALLGLFCPMVQAAKQVTFVSTDYPPYFSGKLAEEGTVAAVSRAAFKAAGYDLKLVFRPWARLLQEVQAGKYDGVVAVWYQADRERYLAYSAPLLDTHIGFYGRREQALDVGNLQGLQTRLIGTVRGYANPPAFEAAGLRTEEAVDDLTNLRKLDAGRLDLVLIDRAVGNWLLRNDLPAAMARVTWLEPPVLTMPLYLGIAKQKPGYQKLLTDFNQGMAEIRRNGEYDRIMRRLPLTP